MKRVIFHVDMDYFFAACEERRNPELIGKAVVVCVYSGRGGERGAVSTCNYDARKYGIKAGMPCSRARKLNPQAVFLPIDLEYYRKVSDEVMDILRSYADRFEQESIDEAFLDVTSQVKDYLEAGQLAKSIKEEIKKKQGLSCSIGVAGNKLLAKIASDYHKPDGLTIVEPENIERFLYPLEVSGLPGVGKKTEAELKKLGVKTVGDLVKIDIQALISIFGETKARLIKDAAMGIDGSQVEEREGAGQIGRITTLKTDTRDFETIRRVIEKLAEDVGKRLADKEYKSVILTAITSDYRMHTKSHTSAAPTGDIEEIKKTADELLKAFLKENPLEIRRIGVRVASLISKEGQKTLLEY